MPDTGWRSVVEDMDVNVSNVSWQRLAAVVGCSEKQGIGDANGSSNNNKPMKKGGCSAGAAAKIDGQKLQGEGIFRETSMSARLKGRRAKEVGYLELVDKTQVFLCCDGGGRGKQRRKGVWEFLELEDV